MNQNKIKKHFPADLSLTIDRENQKVKTFLTNQKISAGLYSYLLERSTGKEGKTVVLKKQLSPLSKVYEDLGISKSTYQRKMKELKDNGYLQEIILKGEKYYWLPSDIENWYFETTLKTIAVFMRSCQDHAIKTYIYLGRKYEVPSQSKEFTLVELGEHTGMTKNKSQKNQLNNQENYATLWYDLFLLQRLGLIDIEQHFKKDRPYFVINKVEKDIDAAEPVKREWTKQTGEDVAAAVEEAMLRKMAKLQGIEAI